MEKVVHMTDNVTTWGICATDGTQFATQALLQAAGKTAYGAGALDPGMQFASLMLGNEDGSGGNGGAFYFAINRGTEFSGLANDGLRDNAATRVAAAGQQVTVPGYSLNSQLQIRNVWVRKLTGTDEVVLAGEF